MEAKPPRDARQFMGALRVTESGALVFNDRRYVFTPGILLTVSLFAAPMDRYGDMLRTIWRNALTRYGRRGAAKHEGLGARGALELYLAESYFTGFGRAELVEFSDSRVVVRIYGSLYGEEAGNYLKSIGAKPEPVCITGYIVEGILNYFAEKEGRPPFTSREVKCKAMGDDYCEFIIERTG